MTFYVYGLIDPRDLNLRYVGYTASTLKKRVGQHCQPSKLKTNSYKNNWIKSIKLTGLLPEIYMIEAHETKDEALLAETELIAYYKYIGCELTNVTDGGEEGAIYVRTDAVKDKISKSCKGRKHTEEAKIKISNSLAGIKRTHSDEHKVKLSIALKGRKAPEKSLETREKLRIARKGKITSEYIKVRAAQNNKSYKLTQDDIKNIKMLYASKQYKQKELGELFNISIAHVCRVVNNKTGKYLK